MERWRKPVRDPKGREKEVARDDSTFGGIRRKTEKRRATFCSTTGLLRPLSGWCGAAASLKPNRRETRGFENCQVYTRHTLRLIKWSNCYLLHSWRYRHVSRRICKLFTFELFAKNQLSHASISFLKITNNIFLGLFIMLGGSGRSQKIFDAFLTPHNFSGFKRYILHSRERIKEK